MRINAKRTTPVRGTVALAVVAFTLFAGGIIAARAQAVTNYGTYIITNVNSGLALSDPGSSAVNGAYVQQNTRPTAPTSNG